MFIEKMLKFGYGSIIFSRAHALDSVSGQVKFTAVYFFANDINLFLMNTWKEINSFDPGAIVG